MQSTSRAPELSATLSRDSCWITGHAPALPRPASASDATSAGSRPRAHGRPHGPRSPRRGRTAWWCAAASCGSGSAARGRPRSPPPSCPSSWTRRCPPAPCGACARRSSRRPSRSCLLLLLLVRLDLAFAQQRVDARDLATDVAESCAVVELTRGRLEAQVEVLLARLGELLDQLGVVELTELRCLRHRDQASS